jgi:hypothetical protein
MVPPAENIVPHEIEWLSLEKMGRPKGLKQM